LGKEAEMTRVASSYSISSLPLASRQWVNGLALGALPSREHLERYLLGMVRRNFRRLTIQQTLI